MQRASQSKAVGLVLLMALLCTLKYFVFTKQCQLNSSFYHSECNILLIQIYFRHQFIRTVCLVAFTIAMDLIITAKVTKRYF